MSIGGLYAKRRHGALPEQQRAVTVVCASCSEKYQGDRCPTCQSQTQPTPIEPPATKAAGT